MLHAEIASRLAAVVCLLALVVASIPDEASGAELRLKGPELVQLLKSGDRRGFDNAVVTTTIDLRKLEVVKSAFTCRECTFKGDVLASDIVFSQAVDLSGSRFNGRVDLRGAAFEATVLFGSPRDDENHRTVFGRPVDFTLATFGDFAGFQWVKFADGADFTLARFRADSVFADSDFTQLADFANAMFAARTSFERGVFRGRDDDPVVRFAGAVFHAGADFRQRDFEGMAVFDRAEFQDRVDFSQTTFTAEASFVDSRFNRGSTFFGAQFTAKDASGFAATFERASASGTLDFDETAFSNIVQFRRLVADSVGLDGAAFNAGRTLGMERISVANLHLAVEDVEHLRADDPDRAQQEILQLIESSARAREDLVLANDARYRLQVLASYDDLWPTRIADMVFYRGAAGYFVRPRRPLLVLLALALTMVLGRTFLVPNPQRVSGEPAAGRQPRTRTRVGRWTSRSFARLGQLLSELVETLALVGRGSSAHEHRGGPLFRLEVFAYRALLVCALLGLANTNPTLRDMLDALR